MSDRCVPVPADLLQDLVDAAERAIWGGGVYDRPTADVVIRARPLLSVPAEPWTTLTRQSSRPLNYGPPPHGEGCRCGIFCERAPVEDGEKQ